MIKTLCVFGTRPEAIKMAPLALALQQHPDIDGRVCVTGQHREMLDSVLSFFEIKPDFDLDVMRPDHSLNTLSSAILSGLDSVFKRYRPDLVLVHGDTTTSFIAALASFYESIPVAHVEAGLRTGNIKSPWPEEANRTLIAPIAQHHFAPTQSSRENLLREGVPPDSVIVTGNTVIDSLFSVVRKFEEKPFIAESFKEKFSFLDERKRMILVTGHRRESFGDGFDRICNAIANIARDNRDVQIVYPVHLNPNVRGPVERNLSGHENIFLIEPQEYLPFVYLMNRAYLLITDSGGVQEEAPSLGKPVLVMRDNTERPEAIKAGTVLLVGTNANRIVAETQKLLDDVEKYKEMSRAHNPYGDGCAVQRIIDRIIERCGAPG
ncbi:UDP-N-acetylglucosamine 2-epimerase (non-hydrolyzing) [Nitratireductor aquimarinus]|uniref:non-hydrolyzing UDP-N-acetylglucosamine 2-epimerase n=1 Tax=Alphaproteobacteria TaxID=28211 RepID=UPI0019D3A55C|nr:MULTISPECIES: UDP-N-acetylglucosamine 2-epimerase (non-hydrolyzing) [Alphaproteobacteria]MBN7755548.1 UDP-N-acetylglucosamine 2-epimerase (non-hydrolyzing) [Nitratireductor aquimarinus]MBY5998302.1 UDP-N-acetylglucosamine 2-epimerase (non-hydrolyzing) [Tritonibacter mobilis]MBY6020333.1 UDP-N-acetylglucosamine 2-epimerase (non-hydrolyzing) [Nitratireductor sp. DP7N14-4]